MTVRKCFLSVAIAACLLTPGFGQELSRYQSIRAQVRPVTRRVQPNKPVLVQFILENLADKPATLSVPDLSPEIPSPETTLPLSHIFSGGADASGVQVTTKSEHTWNKPVRFHQGKRAPILVLGPHGVVGATLDLREYFPALRSSGRYRIKWAPYGGAIASDEVVITIEPKKRVEITVDQGKMLIELFEEDAPKTVANFVELASSGFYTGKTFHRSIPGYMIQGGCPYGDGTGIRSDGKRIPEEINHHRHEKGSVSMALLDDDPDSASCQFFISATRVKEWDDQYTVFGKLVGDESYATLDKLMKEPVDEQGRPTKTIYMRLVRIVDAPSALAKPVPQ